MNSVLLGYLLLSLALLLFLIACGGVARPTIAPTPLLHSAIDLRSALLAASDLPPGWRKLQDSSTGDLAASPCDALTPHVRYVTETRVFQQGDHGARLTESIAAFHAGEAMRWLDAFKQGPTCAQFDEPGPQGTPVTTHVDELSTPTLGDQTFGYHMTTSLGGQTFESDVVYIRAGDNILQVADSEPGSVDTSFMSAVEQKALDKLEANPF